jgi:hypothetical protein
MSALQQSRAIVQALCVSEYKELPATLRQFVSLQCWLDGTMDEFHVPIRHFDNAVRRG